MRLLTYYVLHTFKNQLRKLMHTWILAFVLICALGGGLIGLIAGVTMGSLDESEPPDTVQEFEPEEEETFEPFLFDGVEIDANDLLELLAGGIVLVVLAGTAMGADKGGSRLFLPADVNLLFASPMRPQSVLLFRLSTQLGLALLGSFYMLFQLPTLLNMGVPLWGAFAVVLGWGGTVAVGLLLQALLYVLASTHPLLKRWLRAGVCAAVGLVAVAYILFCRAKQLGWVAGALLFFNGKYSRLVPVWGWLKGLCMFGAENNLPMAALCLLGVLAAAAVLLLVLRRAKADFYEEAMAKSEETAALLEKAQNDKTGVALQRKRDRSERLRRDGLRHGFGANVFFFKAMYNRFRFALFGVLTKTTLLYLAAALGVAALCRFAVKTTNFLPVALTLGAMVFFRALGNPLEQDTSMDCFVLIPESAHAKLFWSLLGGVVGCLLDLILSLLAGALLLGCSPLYALAALPLLVSVDAYATCVGAFIGLSVPVKSGKMLKQMVQVVFIYFGLLPDIVLLAVGGLLGFLPVALALCVVLNLCLGAVFFALSPLFL